MSCEVLLWLAVGEVAVLEAGGVVGAEGGEGPEFGRERADVGDGFVGWAGAWLAAGAVACFGDEGGRGMAVGPGGVSLVVGDVFAGAVHGVTIDRCGDIRI